MSASKIEQSSQLQYIQPLSMRQQIGKCFSRCVRQIPLLGTAFAMLEMFQAKKANAQMFENAPVVWNDTIPVMPMGNSSLAQDLFLKAILLGGNTTDHATQCIETVKMSLIEYAETFGRCVNQSSELVNPSFFTMLTATRGDSNTPSLGVLVKAANDSLPYAFEYCRNFMLKANITETLSETWYSCESQFNIGSFFLVALPVSVAVGGSFYVLIKYRSEKTFIDTTQQLALLDASESQEDELDQVNDTGIEINNMTSEMKEESDYVLE